MTSYSCFQQIEKVLQHGDIGEAVEPYYRGTDIDRKSLDKASAKAKTFCRQLGQYRMPFAWTAINIIDIIASYNQPWDSERAVNFSPLELTMNVFFKQVRE